MKYSIVVLLLLVSTQAFSQHTFFLDTYNPNDALVEEVFDSLVLVNGTTYYKEIKGTYGIWDPFYWTAPCGFVEASPMYPSPVGFQTGNVVFDMEYAFSYPDNRICFGTIFPIPTSRMEISLDSGKTWFHPSTTTVYNSFHTYQYQIEGEGYPIAFRQQSAYNSDDYGMLRIKLATELKLLTNLDDTAPDRLINIYPNPATDQIVILSPDYPIEHAFITSIVGKKQAISPTLSTNDRMEFDISSLARGMYLIHIQSWEKTITKRIIIK